MDAKYPARSDSHQTRPCPICGNQLPTRSPTLYPPTTIISPTEDLIQCDTCSSIFDAEISNLHTSHPPPTPSSSVRRPPMPAPMKVSEVYSFWEELSSRGSREGGDAGADDQNCLRRVREVFGCLECLDESFIPEDGSDRHSVCFFPYFWHTGVEFGCSSPALLLISSQLIDLNAVNDFFSVLQQYPSGTKELLIALQEMLSTPGKWVVQKRGLGRWAAILIEVCYVLLVERDDGFELIFSPARSSRSSASYLQLLVCRSS